MGRKSEKGSKIRGDVFGISSSFNPLSWGSAGDCPDHKGMDRKKIVVMGGAQVSCDPKGCSTSESFLSIMWSLGEGASARFPIFFWNRSGRERQIMSEDDGLGIGTMDKYALDPSGISSRIWLASSSCQGITRSDRYRLRKKRSTMIITSRVAASGALLLEPSCDGDFFQNSNSGGHTHRDDGVPEAVWNRGFWHWKTTISPLIKSGRNG